jgi:hypothetical protein
VKTDRGRRGQAADEFIVLLTNTDDKGALNYSEKLSTCLMDIF